MAHFKSNSRGGLSVDRDSLHASPEFKRQIEALSKLSGNPMTLPQNVEDAVRQLDESIGNWGIRRDAWQTIRAHLMSQEAEIARLTAIAEGIVPYQVRLGEAATKLERANALLREVSVTACQGYDMTVVLQRIQSYLQGE